MGDSEDNDTSAAASGSAAVDTATIRDLLERSLEETAEQKRLVNQLLTALSADGRAAVVPANPSPAEIRRDKFLKLFPLLQKSQKVKDFKEGQTEPWKKWYDRYKTELKCLGSINVNLDLESDPMTQSEFMQCLQLKLEHDTKKRLESAFLADSLTWQTVTIQQIETLMLSEFGSKEPDIAAVLACFGPDRFKRPKEMPISQYYHKFMENLPEVLKPNTNEEFKKSIDKVQQAIFYDGLNDRYIEKEVCNLKGEVNVRNVLDEAIAAEARQKTFNRTGDRCSELTPAGVTSINRSEINSGRGKYGKPWYSVGRGRGRGSTSNFTTDERTNTHQSQGASHTKNVSHSTKPKKPLTCWNCQEVGHTQNVCPKLQQKSTQQHKKQITTKLATFEVVAPVEVFPQYKTDIINSVCVSGADSNVVSDSVEPCVSFGDNVVTKIVAESDHETGQMSYVASARTAKVSSADESAVPVSAQVASTAPVSENFTIATTANDSLTAFPGTATIIAGVILNDFYSAELEVDSAASHNVISTDMYMDIVKKSGNSPPVLKKSGAILRLADGTPSDKLRGCTYLNVRIASNDTTKSALSANVPVFVVDGPNCLLGRPAMKQIMPELYQNLTEIARKSREALHDAPIVSKVGTNDVAHTTYTHTTSANTYSHAADKSVAEPEDPPKLDFKIPDGPISQAMGEELCKKLCGLYPTVFDGGLGLFKGAEAHMHVKPGHEDALRSVGLRPPAKVAYGLQKEVDEKIDEMYDTFWIPIDGRELMVASQVVPVVKKKSDGKKNVRLCVNYKSTINDHLLDEPHVYSTCNEQFDKLKGEFRSTIDLSGAFNQIAVPEGFSQKILAVVTPRGYAIPTRMPFGVKTAPGIWTSNMNKLIHGMGGRKPLKSTACIVDDVCVTGATPKEHLENLHELIYRLYAAGLKANLSKCSFYQDEVKFLGKIVDKNGIRLDPATTSAIVNMPTPANQGQLQSFLGHMSYIGRHVPDVRVARAPLDALMKTDAKFVWTAEREDAFNKCKKLASNAATLTHFDPKVPLVLTTDASPVGLGACLAHRVTENGKSFLKPLSYASCSLKAAERNYAQIDREGLAVYWAVNHYRQYLYGNKFELHTDCSSLVKIFGPKNDLGGCAIGRLNRWAAKLMDYDFTISHIKGITNKTCDSLSRLPVPPAGELLAPFPTGVGKPVSAASLAGDLSVKCAAVQHIFAAEEIVHSVYCLAQLPDPGECEFSISKIIGSTPTAAWDILPLTVKDVANATRTDGVYGKLLTAIRAGELNKEDNNLKQFMSVFDDLYIEQDVIWYGSRLVVPTKQQQRLLEELHQTHFGIVKMKEVSRKYFWWPLIGKQIEQLAHKCSGCRKYRKKPIPAPLCPWPYSRRPMERVHIDYCEYRGKMLLIMVDSFSKYYWCHIMNNDTTANKTLAVLFGWFCERGFPTTLVSDNGPQFTSKEFEERTKKWGVKHLLTPPYHPASNGLAERAVGTVKSHLKKMDCPVTPIELYVNVQCVLRFHNASPQSSTDQSPFELMAKAPIPSLFSNLQLNQKKQEDIRAKVPKNSLKKFLPEEKVLVYNNHTKLNSIGIVKEIKSNNSYIVYVEGCDRHISGDNMRHITDSDNDIPDNVLNNNLSDNVVVNNDLSDNNDEEDTISISSEDSDESDFIPITTTVVNNVPRRRRYRNEAQKLRDALSQADPPTRFRSGRRLAV